jgi:hypothetical protein
MPDGIMDSKYSMRMLRGVSALLCALGAASSASKEVLEAEVPNCEVKRDDEYYDEEGGGGGGGGSGGSEKEQQQKEDYKLQITCRT